jgi:predicted O-linked N-acetylglucosamine transferase (SPINDLY family)
MAADPRLGLAQKYAMAGLYDDAWQALQDLLADDGADVLAFQVAAAIQVSRQQYKSAIVFCRKALALDAAHHETQFNLALALENTGELESASEVYRRALALNPHHAVSWNNLGAVLDRLGYTQEAIDAYGKALEADHQNTTAHNNLGVALMGQGQFSAAQQSFLRALACAPANVSALINLGVAEVELRQIQPAQQHFDAALLHEPQNRDAWDNKLFAAHYVMDEPAALVAAHRAWGQQHTAAATAAQNHDPKRKLRIGYVSPDFKRHSVAFFALPLMEARNRDATEVFCYSNTSTTDAITVRFQQSADHWRSVVGLDTAAAAALIRSDHIDILVDLAGHTVGNRLDIFAARAAPLQITALGYPNTTGLTAMDARLVDGVTDPEPDANAWATERLVRLPQLHCYAPLPDAPVVGALPALTKGGVTFGSFNKSAKISDATVAMWAAILKAVADARLLLKAKALGDAAAREQLVLAFQAHGVSSSVLDLRGWSAADTAHLSLYNEVDIGLDTFPYNGTTTTCEALWMGVPVITRAGKGHAARVGASLLAAIGLPDLVCVSAEAYISKAVSMAADLAALSALRSRLRTQMAASALCQAETYAASVEAAYRSLWTAFCSR